MVIMEYDQQRLAEPVENLDSRTPDELRLLYKQVIGTDPPRRAS